MANESGEGKAGAAASVAQANPSHSKAIDITDVAPLHHGTFHDAYLHLRGRSDFAHSANPTAAVDDRLTTDAVAWRAGAAARREDAQAQPPSGSYDTTGQMEHNAIGRVDKLVGNVTVVRNGVAVALHTGDAVFKSDVIQTGSGSSVGIFFCDGSAVHLVANSRMALNAFSYEAGSGVNAAAFTLIDGTFGFIAGKLANQGDMKIMTPVATMSVHGGAMGWAHELSAGEIASISTKLGNVSYSFAVADHGDQIHGLFDLVADGSIVGSISDPRLISYLDQDGNLISLPLGSSSVGDELAQWLQTGNVVPSALGVHGSGSPIDAPSFPNPVGHNPDLTSFSLPTGSGFNPATTGAPTELVGPGPSNPSPAPGTPSSNIFIWNGLGDWDKNPLDWNQGFAPVSAIDTVAIQSGKVSYTNGHTIGSLTVDHGATLNVTGGSLTTSGITNAGMIELNSSGADPSLMIHGAITLTGSGAIEMQGPTTTNFIIGAAGSGATLTNADNLIIGSGNIGDSDGNLTFINQATVDATPIVNGDTGLLIVNTGHTVSNLGTLEAALAGEFLIDDQLINAGLVKADGTKSSVVIAHDSPDLGGNLPANANVNSGLVEATGGGVVIIENSTIVNSGNDSQGRIVDGVVEAGAASEIVLDNATIVQGFVSVLSGGEISTATGSTNRIDTVNGPMHNTAVPSIVNEGKVRLSDNSSLTLVSPFDIENAGTIELAATGNKTLLDFNQPFAILSGGGNVILDGATKIVREESMGAAVGKAAVDIIDGVAGPGFVTVSLENRDNTISGAGAIGQGDGALAFRNDTLGTVDADLRSQTLLIDTGSNIIVNTGLFEASSGGTLDIASELDNSGDVVAHAVSAVLIAADVSNQSGGKIVADGIFARVDIAGTAGNPITVDNNGDVAARHGGAIAFDLDQVANNGVITAEQHGAVKFDESHIGNDGLIGARGRNSVVTFDRDDVDNSGLIAAEHHGKVTFDESRIDNGGVGVIGADGRGSEVTSERDHLRNSGLIAAAHDGVVEFDKSHVDNDGAIEALQDGVVDFGQTHVDNVDGVIWAAGPGSVIDLDHAVITGGALATAFGGLIQTVGGSGNSKLSDVSIASGSDIAVETGTTLTLEHGTTMNGGQLTVDGTLQVEPSLAILSGVNLVNNGNIAIDPGSATLEVENGATITGGNLAVGPGGTLDVAGSTLANVAISDAGVVNFGAGDRLSPTDVLTFVGNGTVNVHDSATFDMTLAGLAAGEVIDLQDIAVTSAVWNGSSLLLNGVPAAFTISGGLPAGDTFAFRADGHGGTDLEVVVTGTATVADGASLDIAWPSNQIVTFAGLSGELTLDDPATFGGHIVGFSAGPTSSDVIELVGINFESPHFAESYDAAAHQLTVTDGTHSASLTLDYFDNVLNFSGDSHGDTLVTDQPSTIGIGGALVISTLSDGTVNFAGLTGSLVIDNPTLFSGHVQNFSGSDSVDIAGINFTSPGFAETYDATTGKVTVTDGTNSASLTFDYFNSLLNFASDSIGGTVITTQPATITSGAPLEISKLTVGTVNFVDFAGTLKLVGPAYFGGHIDSFSAAANGSDVIDVSGINFKAPNFTESFNAATHQFIMSDGVQSTSFYLDYFSNALNFASDGKGGTAITNQPAGPMTVAAGGRLDVWELDSDTITFSAGTGELKLDNPAGFSGHIAGFKGIQADAADSDVIDLVGIDYTAAAFHQAYDPTTGKFTVTDGANNASFTFDNFNGTLKFASDGNGGTLIFDPPKSAGPGHAAEGDNFIWISQVNQSTAGGLHDEDLPHAGTAAGQPSQMLRSFMQGPPHGEWWAEAGHHDDQLVNVIPDQLQAHLLGAVHLH